MGVIAWMSITIISTCVLLSLSTLLIIWIHDKYTKRNRPIRIDKFLSEEEVGINLYECPVCGNILSDDVYCRYCGQALEREDIYDK